MMLPQSIEAEKALLGAIIIEHEAIHAVSDLLRPEMFYSLANQEVFSACLQLAAIGVRIDLTVLSEILKTKGKLEFIGGDYYLTGLTNNVTNSFNAVKYARNIVEQHIRREQIRIGTELQRNAYSETTDPFEAGEQAEKELSELSQAINSQEAQRIDSVAVEVFRKIDETRHREELLTGVPGGYSSLDLVTLGFQPTDLIIIAARPAVGKTAFTISLAKYAASQGFPAAFFSLEMGVKQLTKRVLSAQARMYLSKINSARLSDREMEHLFTNGLKPLSGVDLYVDDTASLTVLQFKAKLRRFKRKYGIKIAFVDYLQLLKPGSKNGSRQQQIGEISRELKITAKELDIPIVALSQLSREAEKEGKEPQLSHLREAGDIEQDADIVMFLFGHPEERVKADMELEKEIYLKIAKNRSGRLDKFLFEYDKDYQIFEDKGQAKSINGNWKKITEEAF